MKAKTTPEHYKGTWRLFLTTDVTTMQDELSIQMFHPLCEMAREDMCGCFSIFGF